MLDTWKGDGDGDGAVDRRQEAHDKRLLDEVIRQSLRRELQRRRELRPHAQLGVPLKADAATVRGAFERLRDQYVADKFTRHGQEARALAAQIGELLQSAYERLQQSEPVVVEGAAPKPRSHETLRAVETLRRSIEQRFNEGIEHRDAGRVTDAVRSFESVLALDRNHAHALDELRMLRRASEPPRSDGLLAKLVARIRPTRAR